MKFERQDPKVSLEIAEAMVEEYEDYLLEDDLYRQLVVKTSAGNRMLKMTAGSLLELLDDLSYAGKGDQLTSGQTQRLAELTGTVEELGGRYPSAYREKLARELKSQIDSWRWFLQDCRDNLSRCRGEYPFEVRIRNRIALLRDALGEHAPADQLSHLQRLDRELRGILVPGEFILDPGLRDRYPKDRYWWLYGRPAGAA